MATTHAYMALALAAAALPLATPHAPASSVLAAAFLGGLLPDLDLVTNHRKTLHFPVLLPVGAVGLAGLFVALGHPALLVLAVAAGAAGLHALADVLAGGVGHEPWKRESDHAVYNHLLGRWHAPRRLVRYSGAPEDVVVGVAFAVPAIATPATGPRADALLAGLAAGTVAFAATRRRLPSVARSLDERLPAGLRKWLPSIRFEEG